MCVCVRVRVVYLFPCEDMPGQFDHSKVPAAQGLVQVVEASDLSIVATFQTSHEAAGRAEELPLSR